MQNYDGQFELNGQEYFDKLKVEIHLLFLYSSLRRWC